MIKKYSDIKKHDFKSYLTFSPRPSDVPENWIVFEAPRPLDGDKTWRGGEGLGWHYAAVNPEDPFSFPRYLDLLRKNAARVVKYVSEKDYLEWLKTYFEDPEELNPVLADPELLEIYKTNYLRDGEDRIITL